METDTVPMSGRKHMLIDPARYYIRVKGQMGPEWSEWFGGMTITSDEPNETLLSGQVVDQAALYGILNKIRDLGLPLLSILREPPSCSELRAPRT
jgi:hypothetical protein